MTPPAKKAADGEKARPTKDGPHCKTCGKLLWPVEEAHLYMGEFYCRLDVVDAMHLRQAPKASPERTTTLADELEDIAQGFMGRKELSEIIPQTIATQSYIGKTKRLYEIIPKVQSLESELAQRRARDAEIAKQLEKGLSTAIGPRHVWDTNISRTGYLPKEGVIIIRKIINELEARPTSAQETTK